MSRFKVAHWLSQYWHRNVRRNCLWLNLTSISSNNILNIKLAGTCCTVFCVDIIHERDCGNPIFMLRTIHLQCDYKNSEHTDLWNVFLSHGRESGYKPSQPASLLLISTSLNSDLCFLLPDKFYENMRVVSVVLKLYIK